MTAPEGTAQRSRSVRFLGSYREPVSADTSKKVRSNLLATTGGFCVT